MLQEKRGPDQPAETARCRESIESRVARVLTEQEDMHGKGLRGALQDSVRRSLVTATAASSCIACALMGLGANMPVALAPGMGLNAYFSAIVGYRGSGTVSALLMRCILMPGNSSREGFHQPGLLPSLHGWGPGFRSAGGA
jgi:hypothetical protein